MEPSRDFGVCRVKVGLLTLRDCKEPALAECCRCGRAVCGLHQVVQAQGTCCSECAAGLEQPPDDPEVQRARQRREYYGDYGYAPYYAGRHTYFSDSDYRTFGERSHVVQHAPPRESEPRHDNLDDNLDDAVES